MKYLSFIILMLLTCASTWAQSTGKQESVFSQVSSEQRRAELRLALKTPHGHDAKVPPAAPEEKAPPADRHLSIQERKNLRQQLQMQRDNVRSD